MVHAAMGIGQEHALADHVDLADETVLRAERQHDRPSVGAELAAQFTRHSARSPRRCGPSC